MKINIIFYSMYGHIYEMAAAIAEGAAQVEGAEVKMFQVSETLPDEVIEKMGATDAKKTFAHIPVASMDDLENPDAIIFGTPTRFGMMTAQMRAFLDNTGGPLGKRRIDWKSWKRLHFLSHTTWRAGIDHSQFPYYIATSRDDNSRSPLL